ncbi:hypothetical protein AXG93_1330s1010 [Marchantia polymorpha subsp. ruderalis]|uniref:Uncharacterized protein n=1 Tax=Marchantia polymorpha subsp. ruderalis TaxID=1480154 RepID=A0A176VUM4_MARPO|nr:hypothetical protein AXG93_1330s1010 [Marchantia polymorpha subsp. ruderalis]
MMISHHEIFKKEVDGTQEEENTVQPAKLEEPLHFKTTSTGILVGQDVRDYPQVPPDWYRSSEEQTHVAEEDWKYVEVSIRGGELKQMSSRSEYTESQRWARGRFKRVGENCKEKLQ